MTKADEKRAWEAVHAHSLRMGEDDLKKLFCEDPQRFERFSYGLDDLVVDFSKELIDEGAFDGLVGLAKAACVEARRDEMFAGKAINQSENRAALHTALRGATEPFAESAPFYAEAAAEKAKFLQFSDDVRENRYSTRDGAPFENIINIGIGGSHLGPLLALRALSEDADGPHIDFVSNVDGADLSALTKTLDPRRTLIVVASKTFTTQETMLNAHHARAWLCDALGKDAMRHMVAVSANRQGAVDFGVEPSRIFAFWDWVGGRYSLWSGVGLGLALALGRAQFQALLDGAARMDHHFLNAPLRKNIPILLALIGIWRRNIKGWPSVAVIPYAQRLEYLPAYLQQMDMESNGKYVSNAGKRVTRATSPIIWGAAGTDAQHSFFQFLHQGTDIVPVDFILPARANHALDAHQRALIANCLAQSQALAFGRDEAETRAMMGEEGYSPDALDALAPHRVFAGNRPSTSIIFETLDAFSLGRLLALYEHKIFVQGVIWGVNSFDQWGVELGKTLSASVLETLESEAGAGTRATLDSSTRGLIRKLHEMGQDKG